MNVLPTPESKRRGRPRKQTKNTAKARESRKLFARIRREEAAKLNVASGAETFEDPRQSLPKFVVVKEESKEGRKRTAEARLQLLKNRVKKEKLKERRLDQLKQAQQFYNSPSEETPIDLPTESSFVYRPPAFLASHYTQQPPASRPTCYRTQSNEKEAIRKRTKRDQERLDPALASRYILVPRSEVEESKENQFSPVTCAYIRRSLKLTRRSYRKAARIFKQLCSEGKCDEARNQLYDEAGFEDFDLDGTTGVWRSLEKAITELLLVADFDLLQSPIRLTIAIDGGSNGRVKSTKIVLHNSDDSKPVSTDHCAIYAVVLGDEDIDNLGSVLRRLNDEIEAAQSYGIDVEGVLYDVEMFLVADLKGSCTCLGLQGGSALWPCPWCRMLKYDLLKYNRNQPPEARTMENIKEQAEDFIYHAYGPLPKRSKSRDTMKQEHFSACSMPVLTAIPICRYSPPVLHITMAVINETLTELKKKDADRMYDLLKRAQVAAQYGKSGKSVTLTGGDGSKLVHWVKRLPEAERADPFLSALAAAEELFKLTSIDGDVTDAVQIIDRVMAQVKFRDSLTTKLHVLEAHVPEFIGKHRTWARMTEQGVEKLHHILNDTAKGMRGQPAINVLRCFVKELLILNVPKSDLDIVC